MKLNSKNRKQLLRELRDCDFDFDSTEEEIENPTPSAKVRRLRPKKRKIILDKQNPTA